jgi:hypothetical protein
MIPLRIEKNYFVVEDLLDRWARWSHRGVRYSNRVPCMTGRMLAGMNKTKCPTCLGKYRTKKSEFTGVEGPKVGSPLPWVEPCPSCNGAGKVTGLDSIRHAKSIRCDFCEKDDQGKPTGMLFGQTCFKCGGRKRRVLIKERVNPASIHATWTAGLNEDEDPVSLFIDGVVAQWETSDNTKWFSAVVQLEYFVNATQKEKAAFRKISQSYYSKNLSRAHELMTERVNEALDQGTLEKSWL